MSELARLGHSVPLTGAEGVHGRTADKAVRLAVEQANARGDLPFEIELLSLDDKCEPEAGAYVARHLAADPDVFGVVGPFNSTPAQTAAPVYHEAQLAHICPAASNPELSRQGWDTFFRTVPSDAVQGREAARCAVHVVGARHIAVLHDRSAFGQPLAEVFADAAWEHGANIVLFEGIARGQTDFPETVKRVAAAAPDLIYFGLIEAEGSAMAHRLREGSVTAPYLGADGLKPSQYLETPGADAAGPYYTSACTDITRRASAADFQRAYGARFPEVADYTVYTAEAYDATNVLINALRRAGTTEREPVCREVAATEAYPGASGLISFTTEGNRANPVIDFYVVKEGELTFLGTTSDLTNDTNA
jgi:branched-chain amino acid transport system substrate-binding protein